MERYRLKYIESFIYFCVGSQSQITNNCLHKIYVKSNYKQYWR